MTFAKSHQPRCFESAAEDFQSRYGIAYQRVDVLGLGSDEFGNSEKQYTIRILGKNSEPV